ncbi:MAG TPA: branched-chain amino acid ABC transporter permease [Syntrophorhabdaceae bacterium]|nr:branched-chain amino acid ABC transporter permease [Syntrophorhabdaceae bacterium]HOL04786.1 branched-chain amino acid ABC transporter permease [Syntrophorhabdaceae bacterium]HON85603.1 branched-chain amino acid ABC transporter permease [Syntrophorhabdaceae bacterium]HPC65885.1 branched-chain amino acid ABC transporter permease [Syntrophorhabdaceae bacterium]HPP40908.1 branched-chain amino acid ABC transporter permease [Syntrophorhabdaceae bacterium]
MIEKIRKNFLDLVIITAAFFAVLPVFGLNRTTDFIIFCIFVLGFNLLYGYMGRLSFGHMLYLGVGAYTVTLFAEHVSKNPFLAIIASICAGALIGVIIGPIIVRTTGACFALINLAFNQVGYFLALVALSRWTGGEDGMSAYFTKLGLFDFGKKPVIFGFCLFSLLLTYLILKKLISSPYGILIKSIKENEIRVKFLGYNTFKYKWVTFIISTTISAFAGALSILNYGYVTPSFIDPSRAVEVIFATLIGGAGSLYGALIGGVAYMAISNYLASYISRWEMFLGFAMLIIVFRFRKGIWGYIKDKFTRQAEGIVR